MADERRTPLKRDTPCGALGAADVGRSVVLAGWVHRRRDHGNLIFIDSTVDAASGTITAKAEFTNENLALWPGQYFDVEVELGVEPQAAIIPTVALQVGQDGLFVFVITPENKAEMRKVTVTGSDAERSAVTAGLQPGERVVVEGQHRLSPGAPVKVEK